MVGDEDGLRRCRRIHSRELHRRVSSATCQRGSLPSDLPLFVGAALLGAVIGTTLGIKLATPIILKTLGAVLVIAGLKMIGVY
jgi:hypothetical protein